MFGWSISARACRSASKRAITCRVSMPGLMILSATLRRTGCCCSATIDHAHAPFADLLQQLVRADDRAGAFAKRRVDRRIQSGGRHLQKAASAAMDLKQISHLSLQVGIPAAGVGNIAVPLLRRQFPDRVKEQIASFLQIGGHGNTQLQHCPRNSADSDSDSSGRKAAESSFDRASRSFSVEQSPEANPRVGPVLIGR